IKPFYPGNGQVGNRSIRCGRNYVFLKKTLAKPVAPWRRLRKRGSVVYHRSMDVPRSRIIDFLVASRYWLLAPAAVLAAVCWVPAGRLAFDRSIESMFAPDDPLLAPYRRLQRVFGGNEIVLAVYRDDDLL